MANSKHVVISRDWHNPTIKIVVTDDSIGISMPLDDFILAVSEEYGNPAATLTKAKHLAGLRAAAAAVTLSMKHETTRVI